ncbi:hypothetical protein GGI25_005525 [Coemansia spiralis]|uniref:Nucleolar complex-associated protein 3 n=2 Tax=Coemansia TaxID=4863 RepID=A0A9W8KW20_9FUNG|nr:hypothetical protein BX070DRAFT_228038 [Coemansia spiralis]KAJ1989522.1 hypothetical protein EDC05_004639 [Coemansia umbellata]KAJ2623851.1 hypothetical protein GGI26_002090 [Coemansia sp. RSA 1358]KAJ2671367.1 hypothetical protein GGI25_005525 [Coemansia spiralis]
MAGKKATKPSFKAKTKAAAKNSAKTKSSKAKAHAKKPHTNGSKRQTANKPNEHELDAKPDSDGSEDFDDEDADFIRENAKNISFLSSINPEKLTAITKEAKPKRLVDNTKSKVPAPAELSETDNDDMISDADDSDLEIHSDEESNTDTDEQSDKISGSEEDSVFDFILSGSDSCSEEDENGSEHDDEVESLDESDHEIQESDADEYEYRNSKMRRAQKRKAILGGEMEYEQHARAFEQAEKKIKVSNRLPIKMSDGRLIMAESSDDENEEKDPQDIQDGNGYDDVSMDDSQSVSGSDSDAESTSESNHDKTSFSQFSESNDGQTSRVDYTETPDRDQMTRKQYIIAQQNRLAAIANIIMQSPEGGSKGFKLLHVITEDKDPKVKQLGILTQLAVFRDVLPDYRIRELTEKEKQMKVTKEVRQQRMFEEGLVKNYSLYLKQLFAATKRAMKIFGDESADIETGIVAARALGELANAHPHFNFRKDVLAALVDIYVQPSSRISFAPFTPMAQIARLAILRLFRNDVSGEYSQNAVILASKRIKRLSYRVDPSALRPWLHLRLREELRENPEDRKRAEDEQRRKEQLREKRKLLKRKKGGAALREAKRALHESKKQVKARKVQQEVDKSLREADAEVTREEREKWYGETLKQVFITYFRILKQKDNIGGLLPAVLEGLAKYAHLISVEFFVDLFHLLKKIMRGQHGVGIGAEDVELEGVDEANDLVSSRVSLRTSLLCILTALHILTGQGEALNLDLKDFFYQLYALLPPLSANPQIEATRMSALSDGTRYTVYMMPAEIAAANAERIGQSQAARNDVVNNDLQLNEAMWEETVRSESDILFECLEMMFLGRTKVSSVTRVAAFCKRIVECALYWPPKTAKKAVEFIHRLLIKYPTLDRLFSSEEQAGSGLYLKDLDDPDMCNPFATCLYELHWLQIHHHASVQTATARLFEFAKTEEKKHQM